QVQLDVKFIEPLKRSGRRHYQFTAIDDCTRLRVLRIYERLNQKTAIQFVDYVLQKLPFRVERIQTDNGSEFGAAFHWHVQDLGIEHVYIRPRTPRLNGKVERSHRIDAEEFYRLLDGVVVDDAKVFTTKLQEWEDYYNFQRPHGALGGQTPYERLRSKTNDTGVRGHRQLHTVGREGIEPPQPKAADLQIDDRDRRHAPANSRISEQTRIRGSRKVRDTDDLQSQGRRNDHSPPHSSLII